MRRFSLWVLFLTVILDAMGTGLVIPVMPDLFLRSGSDAAPLVYGVFISLYSFVQFISAPLLGGLSDRIGRKPVLVVSIAASAINYVAMALLPPLWILFATRAISGMTGSNMAVAAAYLVDVSEPERRAERFGQLNACMGIGFILGPTLGGAMRDVGLSWPFAVAAGLAALNGLLCLMALPESRPATRGKERLAPFAGFRDIGHFRAIGALLVVFALFAVIGEVGGSVWVFYVEQKFAWQGLAVGASLTSFGLFHALAQAALIGPLNRALGQRSALLLGMMADALGYVGVGLAGQGWMVFALTPVLCLGGIAPSVLEAAISGRIDEDRQGQLQGVLAALNGLAGMIAPTLFLGIYFATSAAFPGLVWILAAALYLLCLPILLRGDADRRTF
jgi:DHA1 family tetracycline resistance protein-like MFS transporter